MKNLYHNLIVIILVVFVAAGCNRVSRMDSRERKSRLMIKAYAMSNDGDYDSAISLCNKALESYPDFARPHLDVALLLHDHRKDYIRAVYHYNRYLEMRPGTEKKEMILTRIKQAEDAFVASRAKATKSIAEPSPDMAAAYKKLEKKNASLMKKIAKLEQEKENARRQYVNSVIGSDGKVSESDIEIPTPPVPEPQPKPEPSVTNVVKAPVRERIIPKPPPVVETVKAPVRHPASTKPVAASEPEEPRSYTVRRGDSLSKIAYRVYNDATLWRKIQNANRDTLKGGFDVKVGQVLIIP